MSGYIRSKAGMLIEKGVVQYRQEDFFKHPPSNLTKNEEYALLSAAQQIKDGRGFEEDKPIVDIALNHLVVLAHCFHFSVGRVRSVQDGDTWKDEIPVLHVVTSVETIVYAQSKTGTDRDRRKRRKAIFQPIGPEYLPVLSYRPRITMSQAIESGQWGEYKYVLSTECQSEGTIEYKHVLFCYALDLTDPCLAVTAERSTYDSNILLLCIFQGGHHKNLGSFHQIETVEEFKMEAMKVAKGILGVDE